MLYSFGHYSFVVSFVKWRSRELIKKAMIKVYKTIDNTTDSDTDWNVGKYENKRKEVLHQESVNFRRSEKSLDWRKSEMRRCY